jgi:ribonuclease T1
MKRRTTLGTVAGILLILLVVAVYAFSSPSSESNDEVIVLPTVTPGVSAGASGPTGNATTRSGGIGTSTAVAGSSASIEERKFPDKVLKTLETIRRTGRPPEGYQGGTHFGNFERLLPANGSYLEYDVDPKRPGVSRNAERIVIDRNSGRAWYTADHYKSFVPIP